MAEERPRSVSDKLHRRAIDKLDWEQIHALASDVLVEDPGDEEAATLRALAERHISRPSPSGRLQATALFADLVDSTPLAEHVDVEVYNRVLRSFEWVCRPAIQHHDGHLIDVKGDGVVACFGFPRAHEDDAWRAVSAGLEILAALRPVSAHLLVERDIEVQARVGIDTGLVMVDDLSVQGAVLNRASRLQALATPGTVLISAATHELVADRFDTEDLGTRELKGVDAPVRVFRVVGERHPRQRAAGPAAVPFVGRKLELERVLELRDRTLSVRRQAEQETPPARPTGAMAMITGDPGIGKTRFTAAVLERTAGESGTAIELYCSSYRLTSTLFPVRTAFEQWTGMSPEDNGAERLRKLEAALGPLDVAPEEMIPFLGALLDLDLGERYSLPELAPIQLREGILQHLHALLRAIAAQAPVVMVIEDVHWADPTTLELLDRVTAAGVPAGMLILVTARPGSDWSPVSHRVERIHLEPLANHEARDLAVAAASGRISERDTDEIVARGDGVPLFVEQLAHAFGDGRGGTGAPSAERRDGVPRTLTQLLQARLDSIPTSKQVAQVAATLGREFDAGVLQEVLDDLAADGNVDPSAALVEHHLARLGEAHLVESMGRPGWLRFRHVLMRDAAYESQLLGDRSARHAAVADILTRAKVADPVLTAFHYDRAGRPLDALQQYLLAVRRAQAAGSFAEVLAHLARCTELLNAVGDETARTQFELAVRLNRGLAVSSTAGYAAPGVVEDFGRARDLCEQLHDVPGVGTELLKALFGVWTYYCASGDFDTCREVCSAIERQLDRAPMHAGRPSLDACRGVEAFYRGDLQQAHGLLTRAVATIPDDDVDPAEWPLPNDPLAAACAFLGPLRFLMGDETGALEAIAMGAARAAPLEFPRGPFSVAFVRTYEAQLHRARGSAAGAAGAAEEVVRIGERHGFFDWQIVGRMQLAAARAMTAASSDALDEMGTAIDTWCMVGGEALIPTLLVEQANGYLQHDELDKARACVDRASEIIGRGQCLAQAEALRIRAELLAREDPTAAERVAALLREAIDVARAQGAVHFSLRAALSHRHLVGADQTDGSVMTALAEAVTSYGPEAEFSELVEARALVEAGGERVTPA